MNANEINKKLLEDDVSSEVLITKFDEQIYRLKEEFEQENALSNYESKLGIQPDYPKEGKYKKKSATARYYAVLLHKKPIITLLIIGAILGCIISVVMLSRICGALACWASQWWWIPLSILFLGPLGLVFIALIFPFIPWILYIIFYIIIHIGS